MMTAKSFSLWVYLSQTPLLWLTVTLLVYAATDALSLATGRHPLANPVLHAMWIIATAVILTGIIGAIIVTPMMNRIGITDFRARGFAVGLASHGIGTARAFQVDAVAGVFAGIAISLNALVTSLLVPVAITLLVR